jgi:hypothetical protein
MIEVPGHKPDSRDTQDWPDKPVVLLDVVLVGWITEDGFSALLGNRPVRPGANLYALRGDVTDAKLAQRAQPQYAESELAKAWATISALETQLAQRAQPQAEPDLDAAQPDAGWNAAIEECARLVGLNYPIKGADSARAFAKELRGLKQRAQPQALSVDATQHADGRWCQDLHCSKCYSADTWQKAQRAQPQAEPVAWQSQEHGDDQWYPIGEIAFGVNPQRYKYRALYAAPIAQPQAEPEGCDDPYGYGYFSPDEPQAEPSWNWGSDHPSPLKETL